MIAGVIVKFNVTKESPPYMFVKRYVGEFVLDV
jgi:hypothetical protein